MSTSTSLYGLWPNNSELLDRAHADASVALSLRSSLQTFYDRNNNYQMTIDLFTFRLIFSFPLSPTRFLSDLTMSNDVGVL